VDALKVTSYKTTNGLDSRFDECAKSLNIDKSKILRSLIQDFCESSEMAFMSDFVKAKLTSDILKSEKKSRTYNK